MKIPFINIYKFPSVFSMYAENKQNTPKIHAKANNFLDTFFP